MEPLEEYHSPFDFEQGVNASYLYLSPAFSDTPPSSPAVKTRGNHKEEKERPSAGCEDCVCVTERQNTGLVQWMGRIWGNTKLCVLTVSFANFQLVYTL